MSEVDIDLIGSIFLYRQSCCLTDAEIISEAEKRGVNLSSSGIEETIRCMAPYLFRLERTENGTCDIFLESPVSMCSQYIRDRKCIGNCPKLHVCPYFQDCWNEKCKLKHNMDDQFNKKIIKNARCHHLNVKTLVKLIQLKRRSSMAGGKSVEKKRHHKQTLADDYSCQMKISFPLRINGQLVTLEEIQKVMISAGYRVRKTLSTSINSYYGRWNIILSNSKDIEHLLLNQLIPYAGTYLRCKPMQPEIDPQSFLLVIHIASPLDRISQEEILAYVSTILGDNSHTIVNIFDREKQLVFVECTTEIDFKMLKRSQKSRDEIHGVPVTWVKVYQVEKICVKLRHGQFNEDLVKRLIESDIDNIFDIAIVSSTKLKLEFINSKARRRWFSQKDLIESSHDVFCSLDVKQVELRDGSTR